MRIVFFVNFDIESSIALNLLWNGYEKHFAGIFYTQTIGGKKSKGSRMLDQLAFVEREVVPSLMFEYLQFRSGSNDGFFLTFDEMARYYDGPFQQVDNRDACSEPRGQKKHPAEFPLKVEYVHRKGRRDETAFG